MRIRVLAMLALLAFAFIARAEDAPKFAPPTKAEADAVQKQGRYLATITMESGKTMELVLEGGYMPYTVANFTKLAQGKFYDGLTFHQVVNNPAQGPAPALKLIQGGDPSGDGTGHPGYNLNLEISPYLCHKPGAVTMFRAARGPESSGSQFVLLDTELKFIDGQFAVFGWVKSGREVISEVKVGDKMKSVTVAPYAGTEPCPILADAKDPLRFAPSKADVEAVQKQGRYLATITMENGKTIDMVLEGRDMPQTVANFIKLTQDKFYDGLTFHRVETGPGFQLIQGGDPKGDGSGSPGYQVKFEKSNLIHKKGALAMARSQDPNSGGCQFYITNCDVPQLDGGYAVFGWVKSGQDVAEAVKVGDKMKSVTVKPYDGAEPCPVLAPPKPEKPAEVVPTPTPLKDEPKPAPKEGGAK